MFINCPHCSVTIEIEKLNCRIFRCGILIINNTQINPHLDKTSCDALYKNGEIYGCGKPFFIDTSGNAVVCDYI